MNRYGTYRLDDSTVAEPLVNKWSVWSDLISPVPYSLHLLHYQVKVLTSYLSDPEVHAEACQDPSLFGGPFVNVPVSRAQEVQKLLEQMKTEQSDNMELAKTVTEFSNYINGEAKGQSLEPFYEKIPGILKGYVELLYDYHSNPLVRFIESLLYQSRYYKESLQSLRLFRQANDATRPFFMSTPRLLDDRQIDWQTTLASAKLDEFFKLESTPQPLDRIRDLLELTPDMDQRLLPLLTEDAPPKPQKWIGPGARVRYFGHACVLVEWNGVSILTDPWIAVSPEEGAGDRLTYKDLPEKIDFALITHAHHDHYVLETLLRLRHKIGCLAVPRTFGMFYADPSLRLMSKKLGFKNVTEMEALDSIPLPDGEITAIPFLGEHADLAHGKMGYVVRAGKEQVLFAADSNCLDRHMYENVRKALGQVQTVFLGMECVGAPLSWMYGTFLPTKLPRNHDQSRRTKGCDAAAAMDLLDAVGGKRVYIYAMGREPWLQYSLGLGMAEDSVQVKESNQVIAQARERGFIDARRPFIRYEILL